jgi:hypothetical protein
MKMLQQIPTGIPIKAAPSVTETVPTIIGKIPNCPWLGDQFIPKIKLNSPTSAISGIPLTNIKTVIITNAEIVDSANIKNTRPESFSLNFFMFLTYPPAHGN